MLSQKIIPENHGLYCIVLKIDKTIEIQVGKLGSFPFQPGFYIYIGSAKGKMKSRIMRHLKKEKKQHWHFDYLRSYGDIVAVLSFPSSIGECHLREKLLKGNNTLQMPMAKFGSSDCKCYSHLLYSTSMDSVSFLKNEEEHHFVYGEL